MYLGGGETEGAILEFIQQVERHGEVVNPEAIPGLCYKKGDSLVVDVNIPRASNIDNVPIPAYDLLPLECYFETGSHGRIITMMTSRGCPNRCIYCVEPVLYGHKFRSRSPESVVKEMRHLHDNYTIDHIVFYDATFNHDKDRVKQISKILIENPVNVTWRARVRADKIDEEMVRLMKQSGCVELSLGVETGSERSFRCSKRMKHLGK